MIQSGEEMPVELGKRAIRDTPVVTCEQAAYLLGEFENNMFPTEKSISSVHLIYHDWSIGIVGNYGLCFRQAIMEMQMGAR